MSHIDKNKNYHKETEKSAYMCKMTKKRVGGGGVPFTYKDISIRKYYTLRHLMEQFACKHIRFFTEHYTQQISYI